MKRDLLSCIALLAAVAAVSGDEFNPLQHLGGNGQWFAGPDVFGIDPDTPEGCTIDQAAFVSRHGSRYPDPSAYYEWTNLSAKIQAANFTTSAPELQFLHTWKPVLRYPDQEISQLSLTGYRELYDMGVAYRFKYPSFYKDNTPFTLWANNYVASHRVLDSARLFSRGYLGPNSSYASIYVVNSTDPLALANSLSPSDLCTAYDDNGGGDAKDEWDATYLPPATARINALLSGTLNFTTSDVGIFPYLCGFESQIRGTLSPWCNTFTQTELQQYEYAQDLRYYYGAGTGNSVARITMLPFLQAVLARFADGPNATYTSSSDGSLFTPPPLIAAFTNDGPLAQLVAALGVFDDQAALPGTYVLGNRTYRASRFVTMRGTVGLERLRCSGAAEGNGTFVRVRLNDAVYPVVGCQGGPGRSCALGTYQRILEDKLEGAGGWQGVCNVSGSVVPVGEEKTTFLEDVGLGFEWREGAC